jgi:hypothetical protein
VDREVLGLGSGLVLGSGGPHAAERANYLYTNIIHVKNPNLDPSSAEMVALLDLPLEMLTAVCQQLDLRDLVRVAETCKRLRHGDGGLETVELPTKSPVVMALREHAFPGGVGMPSSRLTGCSESWVAYLARFARQRRFRDAPPIAAGDHHSLFADGRLLVCGRDVKVDAVTDVIHSVPTCLP